MAKPQKPFPPGWYRHPEMVNTLCYWDGEQYTDKVQPVPEDASNAVAGGVLKAVVVLVAIAAVIAGIYFIAHSNDDLDCSTKNAQHAANGEPAEDC